MTIWTDNDIVRMLIDNPDLRDAQRKAQALKNDDEEWVSDNKPSIKPAKPSKLPAKASINLSEAEFQVQVIELLHLFGWKVAHFRKARIRVKGVETYRTPVGADGAGWPDILAVRGGHIIAAELKSEQGKLTKEQYDWLEALGRTGIEVYIWRPSDYEAIEKLLVRLAR